MKKIFGICLAVALNLVVVVSDSKAALVFGDGSANLALGANFPYVGWMERTTGGSSTFGGSGVLIAPNWVLMSGHQAFIVATNLSSFYDSYRIGFGSNFSTNKGENKLASEIFINPTYTDVGTGFDLALLYFDNPFTSITPVNRYVGDIAVGDSSSIAGYGLLQDINDPTNTQTFTGDRYAGNIEISRVTVPSRPGYVETIVCSNPFLPECQTSPQMGGRPGDSGGGLIINGELAGIVSRGGGNGEFAFTQYTRLDNNWINATIASKATPVPEPGSLILLSTVLGKYLFRRKKQKV